MEEAELRAKLTEGECYFTDCVKEMKFIKLGEEVLLVRLEIICPRCGTPLIYEAGRKKGEI